MTLYIEKTAGSFTQWNGERMDSGELLPLSIEQSWTDNELSALKLYRPLPADPVPEGKVVTETKVKRVSGKVKFVNTLADPVVNVPEEVTMRQARLILSRAGYLTNADNALKAMTGQAGEEARIQWEYAATLRRDNPLVQALGQALQLDSQTVDTLFIEAAKV